MTDESYLYTLIGYIENNPVKAKIVKKLGEYPYSAYQSFMEKVPPVPCLEDSFVFTDFKDKKEREAFLESTVDERILDEIKKASNMVVTSVKTNTLTPEKLQMRFKKVKNSGERDRQIVETYHKGYSQHAIAECLGFSQPYINKILKRERGD